MHPAGSIYSSSMLRGSTARRVPVCLHPEIAKYNFAVLRSPLLTRRAGERLAVDILQAHISALSFRDPFL